MEILSGQNPESLLSKGNKEAEETNTECANCYNSSEWPGVKMREKRHDKSETLRKRNSKNRLSNRRSTGPIPVDDLEAAIALGIVPREDTI